MLLFFLVYNNYQKNFEKDFIYYYIIAIKWGESTHFPGQNDLGQTGNRVETTRYPINKCGLLLFCFGHIEVNNYT